MLASEPATGFCEQVLQAIRHHWTIYLTGYANVVVMLMGHHRSLLQAYRHPGSMIPFKMVTGTPGPWLREPHLPKCCVREVLADHINFQMYQILCFRPGTKHTPTILAWRRSNWICDHAWQALCHHVQIYMTTYRNDVGIFIWYCPFVKLIVVYSALTPVTCRLGFQLHAPHLSRCCACGQSVTAFRMCPMRCFHPGEKHNACLRTQCPAEFARKKKHCKH